MCLHKNFSKSSYIWQHVLIHWKVLRRLCILLTSYTGGVAPGIIKQENAKPCKTSTFTFPFGVTTVQYCMNSTACRCIDWLINELISGSANVQIDAWQQRQRSSALPDTAIPHYVQLISWSRRITALQGLFKAAFQSIGTSGRLARPWFNGDSQCLLSKVVI